MADLPPRRGDDAGDAVLLDRTRAGDGDAFASLYEQEVDAARRLARILVGEERSEELVAESFARVLTQLKAGRGPTEDFRAYLHVTIRNGFRDSLRARRESPSSDQPWLLDDVLPPVEELVEDLDRDVAVSALATLPKSWQQVLWHLEVEGRKPAEVAGILDMEPGAVSSLAYRAREGLKRAYLDQHLQPVSGGLCGWTQSRLSQHVRGDLSARAEAKVAAHVDACSACGAALLTVDRVNQKLAAWLFPVVLWGVTGAKKGGLLWFAGAAGVGAAGTPASGGSANPSPNPLLLGVAGAAVACGIVGGVALAVTAGGDGEGDRGGDTPAAGDGPGGAGAPQPPPAAPTDAPSDGAPDPVLTQPLSPTPTTPVPTSTEGPRDFPVGIPTVDPTPSESPPEIPSLTPTLTPTATLTPTPTATATPPVTPVEAGLVSVTVEEAPDGDPARGPFEVTIATVATGDGPAEIELRVDLDQVWRVSDLTADGVWECGPLVEVGLSLTDDVTCTHAYAGAPPPELVLRTEAPLLTQAAEKPHGTVTMEVDGSPGSPGSQEF